MSIVRVGSERVLTDEPVYVLCSASEVVRRDLSGSVPGTAQYLHITIPISTTYFIYIYYFYGRYYEPIDYDYVDQHYQCEPGQGIDK